MDTSLHKKAFLLTTHAEDVGNHYEILLYAKDETGEILRIVVSNYRPLFFISHIAAINHIKNIAERKPLNLRSVSGQRVDCCYFNTFSAYKEAAEKMRRTGISVYETDIHPLDRFLMERQVFGGFSVVGAMSKYNGLTTMANPHIRGSSVSIPFTTMSIDIENSVDSGALYSIACSGKSNKVFIVGEEVSDTLYQFCSSEARLLQKFNEFILKEDPDILIGWNVVEYDLKHLYERARVCNVPFNLGRDSKRKDRVYHTHEGKKTTVSIAGRVVIDVPMMLRVYYHPFEEYSLNFIASSVLGKVKDITVSGKDKIKQIDTMFQYDKKMLAAYNLKDAVLTKEIFAVTECLSNAIERTKKSGQLLNRTGGSIAIFDYLYLPMLHRSGYVAHDSADIDQSDVLLPGGLVLEPKAGLYTNVIVFDFRSLYPSIIMTFCIDPLGLRTTSDRMLQGPCGPAFSCDKALLPNIISDLLDARGRAKKSGNLPLSQAIKILMNSFYGVLGARNCRFFSPVLAKTITETGQYILRKTIDFIEKKYSYPVIYGDTDSLFIHLGECSNKNNIESTGNDVASNVNRWLKDILKKEFNADSALLLQYENHFDQFLIPAIRGSGGQGSKKHYCGGKRIGNELELHFKGMESVRSDWTDLAKKMQQELITRIFNNADVDSYLIHVVASLKKGCFDDMCIYRKRLRKRIEEYTHAIPPHVQAARLLDEPSHIIRYVMTVEGPQPIQHITAPLDYNHYIETQLQPVADSVLELVGKNFSSIISGQLDLFG